jgi:CheY-like chemotaxis protein
MTRIEPDETVVDGGGDGMASPSLARSRDTILSSEGRTILVVDDDQDVRALLQLALEDRGFNFDGAGNGLAALEKVRERTPDLVILDLNMPSMRGEDFLYAWRAGVETRGVPVIVITATSDALRPTDLGVEAVFAKPFDLEQLLWHIRDLLALPSHLSVGARGDSRIAELGNLVGDLVDVMSMLLATAEQLADAPNLSDEVRALTTTGLEAAHRASALVRRLTHGVGTLG